MSGRTTIVDEAGRRMQSAAGILILTVMMSGCSSRTPAVPPAPPLTEAEVEQRLDRLEAAVIARLMLMPEVARAKFVARKPVHDSEREQAVISEFLTVTQRERVPGWLAENVIRGQLHAAREWQQELIDDWQTSPSTEGTVRDLATELRPEIDRTTAELATSLAAFPPNDMHWLAPLRQWVEAAVNRPATMPERIWWLAWEPFVGPRKVIPNRRIVVQRDAKEVLTTNTRKARTNSMLLNLISVPAATRRPPDDGSDLC
jgi:chorismate mutase